MDESALPSHGIQLCNWDSKCHDWDPVDLDRCNSKWDNSEAGMSRHHAYMNTIGIDLTTRRHHPYGQYRLALDMTCGNHILQLWKDGLQWLQAFAATVVFLSNIGPVKLEPSSADFEILHMWDSPGPRLDIEIRGHFAPIPQKKF